MLITFWAFYRELSAAEDLSRNPEVCEILGFQFDVLSVSMFLLTDYGLSDRYQR